MNKTNLNALKNTATNLVGCVNAAGEDGEGDGSGAGYASVEKLAATLLAIRDTEWSRNLLSQLRYGMRQEVIAVGRKLKAV